MDMFAPKHLLVILVIVLLIFGGKKISTLGSDLGSAFRGFKKAVNDGESEEPAKQIRVSAAKDAAVSHVASNNPEKGRFYGSNTT